MNTTNLIAAIDAQIASLQSARDLLSDTSPATSKRGPGRPKRSGRNRQKASGKRTLSAAGRANIVAAQKARRAAEKTGK